jgi:hypothetical protein
VPNFGRLILHGAHYAPSPRAMPERLKDRGSTPTIRSAAWEKLGGLNARGIANRDEAKARAEALRPILAELSGLSARAIAAELNKRNAPTPNGGPWHSMTVIRVQRRLAS